jgi:hypothetical protein
MQRRRVHAVLARFFEFQPSFPTPWSSMLMENCDHNRNVLAANEIDSVRKMME